MSLGLGNDELLSRFDSLVANGIITHHPSRVTEFEQKGFRFRYEVTNSLAGKKAAELAFIVPELREQSNSRPGTPPQTFGPGSDIGNAHPDLLVSTINDTHLVVMNKFPVFRPQLLLLTIDSFQRQHQPLSLADLQAAWTLLASTGNRFYVMFNGGFTAGASRHHKHLQVLPHPDAPGLDMSWWGLFPDREQAMPVSSVPFIHFLHRFSKPAVTALEVFDVYLRFLGDRRHVLALPDDQVEVPHNVVITKRWIVVIPRSKENIDGTTANSAGMMGSVWLNNEQQLEKWIAQGPSWVLSQLGLSAGELPTT
ncbi:hypothetical protein LTR84_002407 [Exophiala bonariae]|uniref:Phosphorylase n=1 Tax=Exophiala bonariae TaxID=1690606 RepID=A0AAV9N9Q4_9EURO|nr:hypothetical protein LTR84_002407 [Exophiala bonariae]